MSHSSNRVRLWTHAAASRTLPYLRQLLRDLREGFIRIWHLYKEAGYDTANPDYQERITILGGEARALLKEFDRLGVIPYQSPLRGIALFPALVEDGLGGQREAYLVVKDTRTGIDTFVYAEKLCEHNDLYGHERPVPEAWKDAEAVPTQGREVGR